MDMLSDYDNLDVMLGNENNNPIERELAEAIDQSSAHGDDDTNVYHENEFRDYLHENEPLRQNEVRQSFEAFSSEFNLRLSQEMESMMSLMHSQINRAISTAIAERVIPEIQNIANSMSSMGHRDTEASSSPNSQENRESAPGPKIKIAKKDSRSVGDLRDTMGHGSYIKYFTLECQINAEVILASIKVNSQKSTLFWHEIFSLCHQFLLANNRVFHCLTKQKFCGMGIVMRLLNQFCLRQNEVKGSQQEEHKKAKQEQGKNKTTKYALPRETYYTRRKVTVARLHPIREDDALIRPSTNEPKHKQRPTTINRY